MDSCEERCPALPVLTSDTMSCFERSVIRLKTTGRPNVSSMPPKRRGPVASDRVIVGQLVDDGFDGRSRKRGDRGDPREDLVDPTRRGRDSRVGRYVGLVRSRQAVVESVTQSVNLVVRREIRILTCTSTRWRI